MTGGVQTTKGKYNAMVGEQKALPLLLEGLSIWSVMTAIGVREREVYLRLEDHTFRKELELERRIQNF